jgi:hypothetical protein
MRKIRKIQVLENFIIRCEFDNGEVRDLDITSIIDKNGKYSKKVYDKSVFKTVKIGEFGQLYWDGIAEIKTLDGKLIPTEFDICPDYVYMSSLPHEAY